MNYREIRNKAVVALGVYLAYFVQRGFDYTSLPDFEKILPPQFRYNLDRWVGVFQMDSQKISLHQVEVDLDSAGKTLENLLQQSPKNPNNLVGLIRANLNQIKLALKRGHSLESLVAILQEIAGEEYSAAVTKRRVKAILVDLGLSCTPAKKTTRKPRKPRAPKPAPELAESPAETPPVDQVNHQNRATILSNFKR